jgi:hypothetical protein
MNAMFTSKLIKTTGLLLATTALSVFVKPSQQAPEKQSGGKDATVAIRQDALAAFHTELAKTITSAPAAVMSKAGLAGAMGGARLRVTSSNAQEVLLPIPQLADGQVPLCFVIRTTPPDAATEFRMRKTEDGNVAVLIHLAGKKQEVEIAWASVVILASHAIAPDRTPAEPYTKATACVQSQADEISKLAGELWPGTGKVSDFAANIQQFVQKMKTAKQPRSLDALATLQSGFNGICTGNANLAAALMRSKGIACRSVAVIPPISQKLEMHRIVEYSDNGRWVAFDPSSLHADIPTRPWQNIIMARTTIQDEQLAMKPRMSIALGCPYGQEIELLTSGVMLFGADMFWTLARPLTTFEPTEEGTRLAVDAWNGYLKSGMHAPGQLKATTAKSAPEMVEQLKAK